MDIENVMIKSEQVDEEYCNVVEEKFVIKEEDLPSTNETPYKCGICGHRTTTDTLLKVHMKMHLVKRTHQCNICHKTFSFVTELNSHILTHTEEKNSYQCEECGRNCFTEEDLHKHYRVHTKEKPFKCKLCFRSFSDDSYLRIHERSHHGEDYLKTIMKKNGTYVDPNLVQNINETSTTKVSVSVQRPAVPKRRFKNNPNLPLNNEEKLMLLQFVEELGLNKKYLKLEQIKNYLKNGWTLMVRMFAERDYDRNTEKLARTYFHLKNQAKTHIERFYKYKKLPEPHEIDYMFVKLCTSDFDIPGIDIQQIIEDSKKFCTDDLFQDKNECVVLSDDELHEKDPLVVSRTPEMSEEGSDKPETSGSSHKRSLMDPDGPPRKMKKIEDEETSTGEINKLKIKFLMEEEKRRDHIYRVELQQKEQLFEMDRKHREEIYEKELELKNLELMLLKQRVQNCELLSGG